MGTRPSPTRWACATPFGRPLVPEVKTRKARSSAPVSAKSMADAAPSRSMPAASMTVTPSRGAGITPDPSPTTSAAPESSRIISTSCAVSMVEVGMGASPAAMAPKNISGNCEVLPTRSSTRAPRGRPYPAKPPATRSTASRSSP